MALNCRYPTSVHHEENWYVTMIAPLHPKANDNMIPRAHVTLKIPFYQFRKSNCEVKIASRMSYFHCKIFYTVRPHLFIEMAPES